MKEHKRQCIRYHMWVIIDISNNQREHHFLSTTVHKQYDRLASPYKDKYHMNWRAGLHSNVLATCRKIDGLCLIRSHFLTRTPARGTLV